MELTSITPTPSQLKALTHPVRLRMLGLLRTDGPATATGLATRLGLNSGATSYHLRQLAQHGFVEEDTDRGNARERWWRAPHKYTRTDTAPVGDAAMEETVDAYLQSVATVHTESLQHAVEERALLPHAWRDASTFSDWTVTLSPARAKALVEALMEIVDEEEDETGDGTADFVVQLNAFPRPGQVGPQ